MHTALRTLLDQITEDFQIVAGAIDSPKHPMAATLLGIAGGARLGMPAAVSMVQSAKDDVAQAERRLAAAEAVVRLNENIEVLSRHLKGEDIVLAAIQIKGRS